MTVINSVASGLPRGILRRGTPQVTSGLRTNSLSSESSGPAAQGSLTSEPVSDFKISWREQDGITWSAEAKAAFESAVEVWRSTIESPVDIEVLAVARDLGHPDLLGGAGPFRFMLNSGGTESSADDVLEPMTLFNARRGSDARPGEPDIIAEFNPSLDGLSFGTEGNPGGQEYDFKTIVLHELGHGLGLVGSADLANGDASVGLVKDGARLPYSYDTFTYASTDDLEGNGGTRIMGMADGSTELASALTQGQLYWAGQLARGAVDGGVVPLFAPSEFVYGTSYGHLNEGDYPSENVNGLMTPYLRTGEAFSDVGQIAMGMLADMGYAVPALRGTRYTPVEPVRLLDTRSGDRPTPVRAGGVLELKVTAANGVPADATAVVLNVTAVSPSAATDIRVYPKPVVTSPVPTVSNLNLPRGATRANLVTVPIGHNGRVLLRNNAGSVHLVADLAGFYAVSAAATFTPTDPVRLLDTRKQLGTEGTTPVGPGEFVDLDLSGNGSPVPRDAAAVALTVTAVAATQATDVRIYPTPTGDETPPRVSNLNLERGAVVPNLVVVKVGAQGKIRLRNQAGSVHLIADVAGWYDGNLSGSLFRPVNPSRILDTRTRLGTSASAATTVSADEEPLVLRVGGRAQVPSLASAAVLNVTGVAASTSTDIRVYPADASAVPTVSNLNLTRGQTAADLVVAKLGGGSLRLRNNDGQVALVADVAGWFGPPS